MNFLKYDFDLSAQDAVKVSLSGQANVRLMDYNNFQNYKNGRAHKYYGGLVKVTPYVIQPPYGGRWYLAIDLGGYSGKISASVSII
ncbi:DUF1883 domain-containing protein [Pedobacter sp. HMWF019]|uniref:DUF1883 domain-containing protein n=1 Tax=Pedobacter sp. HMWF019 TaxID=2056856 RepID=UPI001E5EE912|nr:DUF1883 domain-containing protein [Pedobacter sp. HMWF019]